MKKLWIASLAAAATFILYACNKKDVMPASDGQTYLDLPSAPYRYFDGQDSIADNKAILGRVLFYDRALSLNNSIACASCHQQQYAFADNVAFSRGIENKLTGRNSLPIQNLNTGNVVFFQSMPNIGGGSLFWDGRESDIQSLAMRPITNHIEMGIDDPAAMMNRLKKAPYYGALFSAAYGTSQITPDRVSEALSMFMISINATHTRFDLYQGYGTGLSALELQGMQLFNTTYNCAGCHNPTIGGYGSMGGFMDIGLESRNNDNGLGGVTKLATDQGKFRIPNLRNVVLTAPYMHDGRFAHLEDVLEHYSHGIRNTVNLDDRLKENGQPLKMNIPESDKKAIIAFLGTLTDYDMITDSKYTNPFKTN